MAAEIIGSGFDDQFGRAFGQKSGLLLAGGEGIDAALLLRFGLVVINGLRMAVLLERRGERLDPVGVVRLDFDRGGGAEGRNRGGELYGRVFPGKPNEPKGDERQGNNDYEKTVQHLLIEVLRGDNSSALDAVISAKNPGEGFGIDAVLFGEDARREGFDRVII